MSTATPAMTMAAEPRRIEPPYMPAATTEPTWVRLSLIGIALLFSILFLLIPLAAVFVEALKKGWEAYAMAIMDDDALSAIRLTLLTAGIAVPANLIFGVAASWAIAKFNFRGKSLLLT